MAHNARHGGQVSPKPGSIRRAGLSRVWVSELLHRLRLRLGIGFCTYEGAALAVDDEEILPPWTWWCRPREDAGDHENYLRLLVAVLSVGWTAVHLLAAWVRWLYARRARARAE